MRRPGVDAPQAELVADRVDRCWTRAVAAFTPAIKIPREGARVTVVTTIDVYDMPNAEYRAVLDRMGVEARPEPGIYLHITAQTDFGYRIIEIWDSQEGFETFAQRRMLPALKDLGIDRRTEITIKPLHNLFAPRLAELPGLVDGLPGAP
jgi:hypothetical protein